MEQRESNLSNDGVIDLIKRKEDLDYQKKVGYGDARECATLNDFQKLWENFKYEMDNKIKEDKDNAGIKKENLDKIYDERCKDIDPLYEEMEILKMKLNCPIPKVTIMYIICSSMAFSFFITCLILYLIKGVYILHPFESLIASIGCLGLLLTSTVSIKGWREFIKNE